MTVQSHSLTHCTHVGPHLGPQEVVLPRAADDRTAATAKAVAATPYNTAAVRKTAFNPASSAIRRPRIVAETEAVAFRPQAQGTNAGKSVLT